MHPPLKNRCTKKGFFFLLKTGYDFVNNIFETNRQNHAEKCSWNSILQIKISVSYK